ncbi:ASB4 protein, partial [Certhia brachydactyla]|nr:ASB4 protein [Certhia brachydactyla]
ENTEKKITRAAAAKLVKKAFLEALKSNDFETLEELLSQKKIDVDTVFEVEDENLILASYKQGYWLPSYKLKISWATGLHLAVMYGHLESLLVLLNHNATINCRPNGKAAIHIACEMANVECLKILCNHGAKLNCFSMSGQAPLHFCTTRTSMPCAQQLLWREVYLSLPSIGGDSCLYLRLLVPISLIRGSFSHSVSSLHLSFPSLSLYSKIVSHFSASSLVPNQSISSRAPLNQAVSISLGFFSLFHLVLLLSYFHIKGHPSSSFLFKFPGPKKNFFKHLLFEIWPWKIGCSFLYHFFISHGCSQTHAWRNKRILSCHSHPRAVEVVVNSYEHIKSTSKWKAAIPEDVLERHQDFYDSLFTVCSNSPRSLMHLCRCAIRAILSERCHREVPLLSIPLSMKKYLLLEPEGIIY